MRQQLGTPVLATGIDHVRLLYHYLDAGDLDGCGSLLDADVRIWSPGAPVGHGHAEVIGLQRELAGAFARHETRRIVAAGDAIAVAGRLVRRAGAETVEFADFFTVSAEGMLLTQHRYYFTSPDR